MARRLLILNGLAILGVILNHSISQVFIAMFWWTDRYMPVVVPNFEQLGSPLYYFLRLIEQAVAYSVPAFLFVSGFFISFVATGFMVGDWKIAWKRAVALVIPYAIWSFITLAVYFLQGDIYTPLQYFDMLLFGRAADHFYYIPLLIQLYLLSPILIWMAKKNWKLVLILSALLQIFAQSLNYFSILGVNSTELAALYDLTPNWLFINKLFWFVLGIVIFQNMKTIFDWLARIKWGLLILLVLCLFLGIFEWELLLETSGLDWIPYFDSIIDNFYALMFIMTYLAFDRLIIPYSKQVTAIGVKSYGIYLTHSLAIIYMSKIIYNVAPALLGYHLVLLIILIACGLGIPLIIMSLVEKSFLKRYYSYLFG